MRMSTYTWIVVALMAILAYYLHDLLVVERQDMGMVSFLIAKGLSYLITEPFPRNNTADINLWRGRVAASRQGFDVVGDVVAVENVHFLDDFTHAERFIRIYRRNDSVNDEKQKPVIVWLHGGGWVLGSVEGDDAICKQFVQQSSLLLQNDVIVASIDYRLAPEHLFPTAVHDTLIYWHWIVNHIAEYGGNPRHVILVGESAGGNLIAAATIAVISRTFPEYSTKFYSSLQESLQSLVMIYPPLDAIGFRKSCIHERKATFLSGAQMEWFRVLYTANDSMIRENPLFAPNLAPDNVLKLFPKSLVVLAKHDVLLDEGIHFANQLKRLQVPVIVEVFNHSGHGFFGNPYGEDGKLSISWTLKHLC